MPDGRRSRSPDRAPGTPRRPTGPRSVAGATASPAGAGRVIAGTARGTRLAAPGSLTRPLGDRVKETLFAILEPELRGAAFLDLFAGSGAAGIEALSRGAAAATFVERDRGAESVIRANLERTHLAGPTVRVVRADVIGWLTSAPDFGNGPFGAALIDPPYDRADLLAAALELLGGVATILSPGAVVVTKHFWRTEQPARIGLLASERARRFGETTLTFYRAAGAEANG